MRHGAELVPNESGIYLLTHSITGDTYVGKATDMQLRYLRHMDSFVNGNHRNKAIRALALKSGGTMLFKVLEKLPLKELPKAEVRWIRSSRPTLNKNLMVDQSSLKSLNVNLDDEMGDMLRYASFLLQRTIRGIVEEAIEDWLKAHGITPDKLPSADKPKR